MSSRIDRIKLQELGSKCQVVLFDAEGKVLESCDTILSIRKDETLFDQFIFLLSIQEVIQTMEPGQPLNFQLVEWSEQKEALLGITFRKLDDITFQWFITDKSDERDQILSVQQSRNNASINEELLEIRQKYLESEKKLLTYKNEELLRIQKFKERFFAEVSHEMRTPLNSITGLVKLLEWSEPKAIYDYLHALKATSEHLNHIINDVLDLSKVEEGKLQLENLSFNLHEITDAVLKGFSMAADEKKISLKSEIDPAVPEFILTDPIRLSQVLYNILGNALKFTHEGGITLSIHLKEEKQKDCTLLFSVKDTGIGMSQESIQKILEPYAQVEGQSYHEYGGTGLGMGIAQRLIEILGGELKISSQKNVGTTMSFEIRCSRAERASYSVEDHYDPTANIDTSRYAFLFAEDDAMSTMIMKERSARWNLKSHFVSSGKELAEALAANHYDMLISDLNLGDDYALRVIQKIRKGQSENRDIPVIFLSGDHQDSHPELSTLSHWAYLVKPVNPKSLSLKIREMLKLSADNNLEPVDLSSLKSSAQGNLDFVVELIDTILEHLPLDMEKLTEAVETKDFEGARKMLHKMNPSIAYLGIKSLADERKKLHDQVSLERSIQSALGPFKTRINIALEDLAAQKLELKK